MFLLIFSILLLSIVAVVFTVTTARLFVRVKNLEKKVEEVESTSFGMRGVHRYEIDLVEAFRETASGQIKRVDEVIKIFDERRAALDDQMKCARVMSDTMVDALKHRLDEAEKKRNQNEL